MNVSDAVRMRLSSPSGISCNAIGINWHGVRGWFVPYSVAEIITQDIQELLDEHNHLLHEQGGMYDTDSGMDRDRRIGVPGSLLSDHETSVKHPKENDGSEQFPLSGLDISVGVLVLLALAYLAYNIIKAVK